jgi:hypothetical protein
LPATITYAGLMFIKYLKLLIVTTVAALEIS